MITWTTPKGTKIVIAIETSEPNLADRSVTNPCHKLTARANDRDVYLGGGFDMIDHAKVGPALKGWFGNDVIPVPADHVDAVRMLLDGYKAEVTRRVSAEARTEADYDRHYSAVETLRATGRI